MGTVILLGYSTAGKSTIRTHFEAAYGKRLKTIDTDREIANEFGGHIYDIFLKNVENGDTTKALEIVGQQEVAILKFLAEQQSPCLIAAGPALPARPGFAEYIAVTDPKCILLDVTAEQVYAGLLSRHERHKAEIGDHANFGSWDNGTTKKFENNVWSLEQEARAVQNINREMGPLKLLYESYAREHRRFSVTEIRSKNRTRYTLYRDIADYLELPRKDIKNLLDTG